MFPVCRQSLGRLQVSACTSEEYYFPGYSELVNKWFGDKRGEHRGAGQIVPLKLSTFLFLYFSSWFAGICEEAF